MPGWVLLLSPDSLGAPELEQEIRLAGFSPRRAPDVARAKVLLGRGGPPAALVVDLAAMDGGLDAISAITRAFSRHFGVAPSEWRNQRAFGDLGQNERQPGLSETVVGAAISSTRVTELRPIEVAFLRHTGPYDQVDGGLWGRVRQRLAELGIATDGLPLGIAQDPPHITPPEHLRFDAGWTVTRDLPPECGLGQQTVGGGTYAVTTYVGPFSQIGHAYELIGARFLKHPEMVVHGAAIEWYRTGSIDEETYLNQVDITFPIKASTDSPRVLE